MTIHTIIALTGPAGAGKDTVADRLVARYGFMRKAHADALKEYCSLMLESRGLDYAYLFDHDKKDIKIPGESFEGRRMLQTVGDALRSLDPQWFIKALWRDLGLPDAPVHDRIVITDVRYPNEADMAQRHGGHLVGVTNPRAMAVRAHSSEQHIGTLFGRCQTVLVNDNSIHGLHRLVDGLCDTLELAPRISGELWAELNA